jgi:GNAT superfamily N-acetyltransferase
LAEFPAIEGSAAELFRGSAQPLIADDEVSPEAFYLPLQAAGLVWVGVDGDRLTGFAACEAFDDGLHLWELAVRHEDHGRGIGRALLAAAADEGRKRGLPALTLTTFEDIPWNAPFYARVGFRQLPAAELNGRLEAVLAQEARRGLTRRCAMRLPL